MIYWETRNCWRNSYSTGKKRWNSMQIETIIIKMEHYEISKLLNDSIVSIFLQKNGSE